MLHHLFISTRQFILDEQYPDAPQERAPTPTKPMCGKKAVCE